MGKLFFSKWKQSSEIIIIFLNTIYEAMVLFSLFTLKLWKF